MRFLNNHIATEPFPTTQTKTTVRGGLPVIEQKTSLTRLRVVFACEQYAVGDYVFVDAEACKHEFAKHVYQQSGIPFIVVPFSAVVAEERQPLPKPDPTRIPGAGAGI